MTRFEQIKQDYLEKLNISLDELQKSIEESKDQSIDTFIDSNITGARGQYEFCFSFDPPSYVRGDKDFVRNIVKIYLSQEVNENE